MSINFTYYEDSIEQEFYMENTFSNPYCQLHPNEIIINYCLSKQCLAGLCANCLGVHTQLHLKRGIPPEYENVKKTYQNVINEINSSTMQIKELKTRIDNVEVKVRQKKQKVKQVISMAKNDIILLVQRQFKYAEQEILHLIQYKDRQKGLHCLNRLERLKSDLHYQAQNIKHASEGIRGMNFIQKLNKVKTQILHNANLTKISINEQIVKNQNYFFSINYDKKKLDTFKDILRLLVEVRIGQQLLNQPTNLQFCEEQCEIPQFNELKFGFLKNMGKSNLSNLKSEDFATVFQKNNKEDISPPYQPIYGSNLSGKSSFIQNLQIKTSSLSKGPNEDIQDFKRGIGTEESRVTTQTKKNFGQFKPKQEQQLSISRSSTSGFNYFLKGAENNNKALAQKIGNNFSVEKKNSQNQSKQKYNIQKDENNFTFGSQVCQYNPFQALNKKNEIKNSLSKSSASRVSESKKYLQYQSLTPANLQQKKIKQNISKMQKKSNNLGVHFNNSQFQSFYPEESGGKNSQSKKFIFRTQNL